MSSTVVSRRGKFSTNLESLENRTLLSGSVEETVALPLTSAREPSLSLALPSPSDSVTVAAA